MEIAKKDMKQRFAALVAAGVIASAMAMPTAAFADNSASAGAQSGSGTTSLNMITRDAGADHTASDANVAFTFPASISYVVAADGALTGPAESAAYIQSASAFQIHVEAVGVAASNNWHFQNLEANVTAATSDDNVYLMLGPSGHQLNMANYTSQANIPSADAAAWNMEGSGSKVGLASSGKVGKVKQDITSSTEFGKITWHVHSGPAATA